MIQFIRGLLLKYKDIILYLIFGVLTTLVSFVVYSLCFDYAGLSGVMSNAVSWVCAVVFAFLTNKPFVFRSYDWARSVWIPEAVKFVGGRIGSGVFESLFIWITVDILNWHHMIMKLIASGVVVILNYIISKLFVFRNNK